MMGVSKSWPKPGILILPVADADYARDLITLCGNRFGRVDGLVNNAAVGYHAPPWEDDDAMFWLQIDWPS